MTTVFSEARFGASLTCPAFWREVGAEIRKDALIYGLVGAQALAAFLMAAAQHDFAKLTFIPAAQTWLQGVALLALIYLAVSEVPPSVVADPLRPLALLRSRLPLRCTPRVPAGILLVLAVILSNGAFTSVKNMLPAISPYRWDAALADAGRWLHGGHDPWRLLQPLVGHPWVTRVLQYNYVGGWLIMLCGLVTAAAFSRRLAFIRRRFFLTFLFCWVVLGNVLAGIFMSAGPAYFGAVTGDRQRFAGLLDYLSFSDGLAQSSTDLQGRLWSLYTMGHAELGSGISAFPSLHVAMATLFALTCGALNRWAGAAALLFLAVIMVSSVCLAWHYAVDSYASALLTTAAWFGFAALERRYASPSSSS
jgi:hypothetical protein